MAEKPTKQPFWKFDWTSTICAYGGMITGVVAFVRGVEQSGLNGAIYLAAAALAFGLIAIAVSRE